MRDVGLKTPTPGEIGLSGLRAGLYVLPVIAGILVSRCDVSSFITLSFGCVGGLDDVGEVLEM